jgi:hypothetical protein
LPNLNYLVNSSKLRKGSIIRLERFNLNEIVDGKILVIEDLTVLRNTLRNGVAINDNERKSIMNNNLAETLKSIGIIGSLKPTSNNKQIKLKQQQLQENALTTPSTTAEEKPRAKCKNDISGLVSQNFNNNNSNNSSISSNNSNNKTNNSKYELIELKVKQINKNNESTDKNNNKNKFKEDKDPVKNKEDELDEENEDFNDLEEEADEYEEEEFDEEDELDYEDEDENEESEIEKENTATKSVVDIILCKCNSCKEQNTLKLCYKLLGLSENSSLEQVQMSYLKLNSLEPNEQALDVNVVPNTDLNNKTEHSDCNLDKLIRSLLKKKVITINDTDRREIRAKAYYLILS